MKIIIMIWFVLNGHGEYHERGMSSAYGCAEYKDQMIVRGLGAMCYLEVGGKYMAL